MGRRTVLHVTTVHTPLDPRIFYKEARSLAMAGWRVSLATTTSVGEDVDGVTLLPLGRAGRSRFGRIPRNWRALKLMLGPSDIIHIHDPELLVAALVAQRFGKRIVYDVHEFYHTRFESSYWLPTFLRPLGASLFAMVERLVVPKLSGVVVVSEAMIQRYRTLIGGERVVTVHNFPAIDGDEIKRSQAAPRAIAEPYFIHTGEASKNRMFHVTVQAVRLLRERGNNMPFINLGPVDLSGYDTQSRTRLLREAQQADIRLLGRIPFEDAAVWLAHAHVGYLPLAKHARNIDTLPLKLFEYFAYGLPVVAAGFGAIERTINAHSAGLLVPYDDPDAHANALQAASTNQHLHQRLSEASRRAASHFSFATEFPRLEALYERILNSESNSSRINKEPSEAGVRR